VSLETRWLLDVDALRPLGRATLGRRRPRGSTVVLGSRQDHSWLDGDALRRDGVELRRRRGGGGAVLLREDDCWFEMWLPASSAVAGDDVRATACVVGEWWRRALGSLGVEGEVHRSGLVDGELGAIACFAGLGPGEISVGGRKMLGLSQWRSREGVLVSAIVPARPPGDLFDYLAPGAPPMPALRAAASLELIAPSLSADALAASLLAVLRDAVPGLEERSGAFA